MFIPARKDVSQQKQIWREVFDSHLHEFHTIFPLCLFRVILISESWFITVLPFSLVSTDNYILLYYNMTGGRADGNAVYYYKRFKPKDHQTLNWKIFNTPWVYFIQIIGNMHKSHFKCGLGLKRGPPSFVKTIG